MAILPVRRFRVLERRQDASETFSLILEPADGEPLFPFLAGQFVMLHLFNADGSVWAKAAYSIATAPHESKTSFELAIKLAGDFTKRASILQAGDEVGVQGPYGAFVLKPDTERYVFFAAGVGVTPLRSMIREALLTNASLQMHLLYTDKTRDAMAYEDELRELATVYSNFHPVFILTREQPAGWEGETHRMDAEMVRKYLPDLSIGRYAMCGPTEYMESIKKMLTDAGVDIKAKLQRESFG